MADNKALAESKTVIYLLTDHPLCERSYQRDDGKWLTLERTTYTPPQPQGDASPERDRESDRRRFSDPAFNRWLDDVISDAGHTAWDAVGDVAAAWAGWDARQFAGDAVLIAECCGREECGGECGNEWRGMGMYRRPDDEATPQVSGDCECPRDHRGQHIYVCPHVPSFATFTSQARPDGGGARMPDGFAYCYPDGTVRHSNGREINAMRPTEAIPYYYGSPTPAPDAVARLVEAATRLLPTNVCLDNYNVPDREQVPLLATLGELRAMKSALAPFTAVQQGATNGQE